LQKKQCAKYTNDRRNKAKTQIQDYNKNFIDSQE